MYSLRKIHIYYEIKFAPEQRILDVLYLCFKIEKNWKTKVLTKFD